MSAQCTDKILQAVKEKHGTCKTLKAGSWPWLSGDSSQKKIKAFPLLHFEPSLNDFSLRPDVISSIKKLSRFARQVILASAQFTNKTLDWEIWHI